MEMEKLYTHNPNGDCIMKTLITITTLMSLIAFSGQITQTTPELQTILDDVGLKLNISNPPFTGTMTSQVGDWDEMELTGEELYLYNEDDNSAAIYRDGSILFGEHGGSFDTILNQSNGNTLNVGQVNTTNLDADTINPESGDSITFTADNIYLGTNDIRQIATLDMAESGALIHNARTVISDIAGDLYVRAHVLEPLSGAGIMIDAEVDFNYNGLDNVDGLYITADDVNYLNMNTDGGEMNFDMYKGDGSGVMDFRLLLGDFTSAANYRVGIESGSTGANRIRLYSPDSSTIHSQIAAGSWVYFCADQSESQSAVIIGATSRTSGSEALLEVQGENMLIPRSSDGGGSEPDGAIYYDTDSNKFRGRANGSWINLH